jgi:hypothetical protein
MKKLTLILALMMAVTSCSQIATNADEESALKAKADDLGDLYVACVVDQSMQHRSVNAIDVATSITLAGRACAAELDGFTAAQTEYLSTKVMMTEKPLQASIDALNERATAEVGEAFLLAAETQPAAAMTAAAVAASGATSGGAAGWTSEQQAYLDCMEEQAGKYAGLDESAPVIADVAHDRCKSKLVGPGAAALEQAGRASVMGLVLDAKLERAGPAASE